VVGLLREELAVHARGAVTAAIGGVLLLAALLTAVWALNTGLTSLLAQVADLDVAIWLSPLLLTVALAGIGWSMIRGARAGPRARPGPDRRVPVQR
jgi:hypothetical protein